MEQNKNRLFWCDFETTGLDPDTDHLLEVGAVITDTDLNEISTFAAVFPCDVNRLLANGLVSDVVRGMHDASGLWNDCQEAVEDGLPGPDLVQDTMVEWIRRHDAVGAPWANNNAPFDRGFAKVQMPRLIKVLHYRNLDVSSIKVVMQQYFPSCSYEKPPTEHRGLADARSSIAELKAYLDFFRTRSS